MFPDSGRSLLPSSVPEESVPSPVQDSSVFEGAAGRDLNRRNKDCAPSDDVIAETDGTCRGRHAAEVHQTGDDPVDSESLDRYIQTALSALYPPFQATSSTVLCQVLNVVQSCYRGDGLRYLLHFLLPAKQFLLNLQQHACLQYCGLVFRHEGWPLCVHEKVVVQLCPLDQRLLYPGDFYLLVSPPAPPRAHSASCRSSITSSIRLLLCSLSAGSHHVEQQEVSEIALRSLFSMAWLDSVNREKEQRGASRLERCLLSANGDVFRVPWEHLVYPQFISRPRTTLKEDKESSVKDRDMLINTSHDLCRDMNSSRQNNVKLLPSSIKTDQSPASSEAEDSEGEYVELTELPLPRFSPQKGSLTQSISLQHRARTSTHTSAHTPQSTHPHSAATIHTPHTHPAAAIHTPHTHPAAPIHTPQTTNTHSVSTTHSSWPCVEVSSHIGLCSKLTEENLKRDSCGPVILTPIATTPTSSAPPEVVGASSSQSEPRTSQEQTEGIDSDRSVNTDPEKCREQREDEEVEKVEWERQGRDGEREEQREEGELMEKQERKHGMLVSVDEGAGKEEEEVQEEETECRSNKDLLRHTHTAEWGGEMEEEDESGETDRDGEEGEDELEEDGAEEVEVEEEVQVIIVQQSQERREEEQVTKGDESEGRKDKDEEERQGGETHTDKETDSCTNTHSEDSYCEKKTHSKDSYSEKKALQTHSEDSYCENNTLQTHFEDSYCEKKTHSEDSYCEKKTQQTHSEDSYSEKKALQTHSEDSYSEKKTHSEDSYCENNGRQPQSGVSKKQHTHSEEPNTLHTQANDSYSENNTLHTHSNDSYSENIKPPTYSGESEESTTSPSVSSPVTDPDSLGTEPEESGHGQEEEEEREEEEEEEEEEVGGGATAELQTEGLSAEPPPAQSGVSLSSGPSPAEPEQPAPSPQLDQSAAPTVPVQLTQSSQSSQSSFYSVLLSSGALCLPGTGDRSGRALLTVCTRSSVWSHPDCDRAELLRLLLYYTSTLRKEQRALGLTVLVDARRAAPDPALFSALRSLQDNVPGSVHTVLLLVNKDSSVHVDRPAAAQVEVLSSLKSVQKHVDLQQLPAEFGGSFSFSQSSWLCFRSRAEQLTNQCEDVINLLQKTINILQATPLPAAAEDAELLLSRYKVVMGSILEDRRLVRLQQEGGASLSRLRREESGISATEGYRAEVEAVSSLYDQVDELLHRLVTLSNSRTQELNFILDFKGLEQGFTEVRSWLEEVGEVRLKTLDEPEDSLELLDQKQQDFKDFYTTAYDYCKRGEALLGRLERWDDVSSGDLHIYEVKVHSFWAQLQDFSQRVNTTGQNIDRAVRLYRFLDQAYGWALEGMRDLAGISMEECTLPDKCQAVIGCLEDYRRQHPPIPDACFQEMRTAAGELRGERGLRQWSFAWSKCQETKKMFDRKMEAALRTRDSAHRRRSDSALCRSSASSGKMLSGLWGARETSSSSSTCPPEEDTNTSSPPRNSSSLLPLTLSPLTSTPASSTCSSRSPPTPQHTPLLHRLFRSSSSEESADRVEMCSSSPSLLRRDSSASFTPSAACSSSSFSPSRRQQLRKTQSFDCPSTPETSRYGQCPRALSEPVRRGNTGVFIRGLEVSSTEAADRTLCPRTAAHGWLGQGLRGPGTPSTQRTTGSPTTDPRPRGSKLRHIVEEMVTTEREYVRSLQYIIHHYFPEMDRVDLPQDLRGKRSVVFGNLEKLLDFHSQFFLRELEACWKHPLRVPHCFLRHQEQFSLYALYSKNKPKSDTLLANHGNSFFRRKQVELGDKMDLSSYLLKPIQRMSKYALLLTDLIKEVGVAQEAELVALQAATNMVKFQLRHGNDLLAMDAIRDCDVNLKEQGQLIRQDEFTVWTGRRKCQRHIFLFEELVLFSKPKKMEGGLDVFIYKHSFKTADVGLTESTGDSGLRFEIWFRRRTSKNQTFILQAATSDIKHAWTSDIARILWTQATRNKETRLKEMVSMGVGNKPFLDIQPSDAAISDRAVHYIMKSRGARTRASIAVSVFDHSNPFRRAAVTSDPATAGPSSCSLLGPLNLHMYSQTLPPSPAAESSFITSCIEEDEQEHETSSQPSMTTESSGSSSRCLSGSTGSDSGCASSHLQEALHEEASQPSSNKQHLSSQFISAKPAPVISPATIV